jgi:hypothetical protein
MIDNLLGDPSSPVIDAHLWRLLGMLSKDPEFLKTIITAGGKKVFPRADVTSGRMRFDDAKPTMFFDYLDPVHYRLYADLVKELGQQIKLDPGPASSALRIGSTGITGARNLGKSVDEVVKGRIAATAKKFGIPEEEVDQLWQQFVAAKRFLWGVGAAAPPAVGALGAAQGAMDRDRPRTSEPSVAY